MKIFPLFLTLLIPCAQAAISAPPRKAQYQFDYHVEFAPPPATATKFEAWIPIPHDTPQQKVLSTQVKSGVRYRITTEKANGNRMVYLQADPRKIKFPLALDLSFQVERSEARPLSVPKGELGWAPAQSLHVDRKIPLNGVIAQIAAEKTKGLTSDKQKIRALYEYVVKTMTYSKEGKGWGEGDAVWACDNKRGNCTDFHSFFIGMARSQKIPARFEIGFPIPNEPEGKVPGYHCWAWAFESNTGWLPLDASEANKQQKMFEYLGYLPNDRIQFTSGRDLILEPAQKGEPVNYFVYPYVEIDGASSANYTKEFRYKRIL